MITHSNVHDLILVISPLTNLTEKLEHFSLMLWLIYIKSSSKQIGNLMILQTSILNPFSGSCGGVLPEIFSCLMSSTSRMSRRPLRSRERDRLVLLRSRLRLRLRSLERLRRRRRSRSPVTIWVIQLTSMCKLFKTWTQIGPEFSEDFRKDCKDCLKLLIVQGERVYGFFDSCDEHKIHLILTIPTTD